MNEKTFPQLRTGLAVAFALLIVPVAGIAQTTESTTGSTTGGTTEGAPDEGAGDGAAAETPAEEEEEATPAAAASTEDEEATAAALTSPSATTEEGASSEGDEEEPDGTRTEEEAEEAQAASEPLAWRNSFFTMSGGMTFNTLDRGGQLSYNPYAYLSWTLTPRWYLANQLFLVASLAASYELTNTDTDTYNHEIALSDWLIELRYTAVVDRFVFIPAARLTFPTSKLSQAAQRYFNTGLGLTTVLQIPEFLSGNIALGLAYRRWWAGSNVFLARDPIPGMEAATDSNVPLPVRMPGVLPGGDAGFVDSMGGAAAASDRILTSLTINVTPVSGLTVTLQGVWVWDHVFDNAEAYLGCETILSVPCGTAQIVPMAENNRRWRWFTAYTLQAAYDLQPWLNLGLGVTNALALAPFFNEDGSVRSPFNPDTQVFLSATVTLDGLYETLTAGGEEDGLTPEERQRRRQGLAELEDDILEDAAPTTGTSTSTGTSTTSPTATRLGSF